MSEKNRVYGLDLGTTYSCIASVDDYGQPVVHPNSDGEMITPSVVYFEEDSEKVVVGQVAKEAACYSESRVVSTVKRVMGTDAVFEFDGKSYKPQDISAFIIKRIVQDARDVTGEKIEDVVITCPAYFGFNEKEATKQAGEIAGLNILHVIPEPTAAAIAYGINQDEDQTILVYDLGGGTFDITLIEVKENAISVVATDGNKELGGKNWDDAIVAYLAQRFEEEVGVSSEDLENDDETYQTLQISAEKCKRALTTRDSITEPVRFGSDRVKVELTREKFEDLTKNHLDQTMALTTKMIADAADKRGIAKIDKLLMVGGATYMPQVETALEGLKIETMRFDPNQAVAKGAAIYGYKFYLNEMIKIKIAEATGKDADEVDIDTEDPSVVKNAKENVATEQKMSLSGIDKLTKREVMDITSKSFGIVIKLESGENVVNNLAVINQRVPWEVSKEYGTYADNQTGVELRLMQNEEEIGIDGTVPLDLCDEIDTIELKFDRALPKGSPIEVHFRLEADGRLTLRAFDKTTGQEAHIETTTSAIMSEEEIAAAKSRAIGMNVTN